MFLFSDALNIFYLRLYGIRHMVKDSKHHGLCYTSREALAETGEFGVNISIVWVCN